MRLLRANESAPFMAEGDPGNSAAARLAEKGLFVARAGCLAAFALALGLLAMSLPAYVAYLRHLSPGAPDIYTGQLTTEGLAHMQASGLSLSAYIAIQAVIKTLFVAVWLLVGAMIFWRKSNDPFALFVAFTFATFSISFGYWAQTVLPPASGLLKGLNVVSGVCLSLLLPLFPDGRFVPRWSKWLLIPTTLFHQGLNAFFPTLPAASPLLSTLDNLLFIAGLPILAAFQIYRYRRVSTSVQRQQTKWAIFGFVLAMIGFSLALFLGSSVTEAQQPGTPLFFAQQTLVFVSLLFIPLSIGAAIQRSHLWDIDILINRALVYTLLTGCVVGLYVLVVGYLGAVFRTELNLWISMVAAGLVAVIFQPLQLFLQRGVNRLLYGLRDEPYVVLSGLSQRLKASLSSEEVLPAIVQGVREALKLAYAAIEVDEGTGPVVAASIGVLPSEEARRLPLVYQGQLVGMLLIASRGKNDPLNPADLRLLESLADQIGVAVHAVRLNADLQRSRERMVVAQEEERRRLRRDLHDGVGPTLASLSQRIDIAARLVKQDPDGAVAMLATLKGQVRETLADIRRLVYALRPPVLDELGLLPAIQQRIEPLQGDSGLLITVEAPPEFRELPAAVEVAAYRIVLEALTNVQRHAGASRCAIHLELVDGCLALSVCDDGKGLPAGHHYGVGLTAMQERAAELGGAFEVTSDPGQGTCIHVRLPL